MQYLLDTDICVYIARRKPGAIWARWQGMEVGELGMSVITYLELVHGAIKSQQPEANLARVEELREHIPALSLGPEVARTYVGIRRTLEKKGTRIGPYDLVIAAHAVSLGLTLVTANVREFARVEGLQVENWAR